MIGHRVQSCLAFPLLEESDEVDGLLESDPRIRVLIPKAVTASDEAEKVVDSVRVFCSRISQVKLELADG